jgi:hypothetical protein
LPYHFDQPVILSIQDSAAAAIFEMHQFALMDQWDAARARFIWYLLFEANSFDFELNMWKLSGRHQKLSLLSGCHHIYSTLARALPDVFSIRHRTDSKIKNHATLQLRIRPGVTTFQESFDASLSSEFQSIISLPHLLEVHSSPQLFSIDQIPSTVTANYGVHSEQYDVDCIWLYNGGHFTGCLRFFPNPGEHGSVWIFNDCLVRRDVYKPTTSKLSCSVDGNLELPANYGNYQVIATWYRKTENSIAEQES